MTEAVDPQAVVLNHIRRNPGADAVEIAEDNAMEPVAVVQDLTTKYGRCTSTTMPPENWSAAKMDVTTSAGEHLTTQTFIPESKWRANDAKEDVEAWLHRELDAVVRGARERGLQASATVEWGTGGLRGDLTVQRGVRA